jgi:hypothetical protein
MLLKSRRALLLAGLALTVAAVLSIGHEPADAPVAPATVPAERGASGAKENPTRTKEYPTPALALESLEQRNEPGAGQDLFQSHTWNVPTALPKPGTKEQASAPPAPAAPPFPFAYIGRIEQDGETLIFLTKEDRNYIAKDGEVIDGNYRLEQIGPRQITFTYLPLGVRQALQIEESN